MGIDLDKFLNTAELVSKAEYNADIAALVYLDIDVYKRQNAAKMAEIAERKSM